MKRTGKLSRKKAQRIAKQKHNHRLCLCLAILGTSVVALGAYLGEIHYGPALQIEIIGLYLAAVLPLIPAA